jgi:hypothetical protein
VSRIASFLIVLLFLAALAAVQHASSTDTRRESVSSVASNVWSIYRHTLSGCDDKSLVANQPLTASVAPEATASSPLALAPDGIVAGSAETESRPRPARALPLLGMVGLGSLVAGFIMRR